MSNLGEQLDGEEVRSSWLWGRRGGITISIGVEIRLTFFFLRATLSLYVVTKFPNDHSILFLEI